MAISTLDLLIKKTAIQLIIDESIVEKVIGYKWKSLAEALSKNTVCEDSGLGKYKVRFGVVKKKLEKLETILEALQKKILIEESKVKKNTLQRKIDFTTTEIAYLKTKLESND